MNQIPDILQIERENRRQARERRGREQQDLLHRPEMGDQQNLPPPVPPFNGERNEEQQNHQEQQDQGGGGFLRQPQQNRRPIGAYDEPNTRQISLGIIPPQVPTNSFELKAGMLGIIERSTFKGNAVECPLEHLHRFERLSRTFKMSGIPEDTVKMMLFPFSLEDKAAYWEKTIPSNQVATWGDVKTAFLKKFFPKQKTAKFRNNIQSFVQRGDESLSEAWDRLKDYTRSCPHHGFTQENLLGIFYRGVLNEIRRALDTASYGSFASLDVDAAEQLIENMAQSDACFGGDYDRTVRGSSCSVDSKIEKLNDRFDKLTKMLMGNQRHVAFVDGTQGGNQEAFLGYDNEGAVENQEEVNYLGNQGGYNNYKPFNSHPNLSYRSTNVENPQDQTYPTHTQGQAFNNNFQPRPQQSFGQSRPNFQQQGFQPKGNFQGSFQPRGSGFQAPTAQPSQDPEIKTMLQNLIEGQTRGQRENEKRFKEVESQIEQVVSRVRSLEGQVAQIASTSQPPMGTFPGKAVANPKAPCNAVLESGKVKSTNETVSSEKIQEPTAEKGVKEKMVGAETTNSQERPLEDPKEKLRRIIELVEREERLEEEARKAKEEAAEPRPVSTLRTLNDKGNPGKFNIPVSLGGKTFEDALCDSGSYVNVISWELVKELKIKGMESHSTPIMFGDASKKMPKGVIKRCPIIVGNCIVPSDFLVIDMVDAENQPLLLGAPFLQIAGAVIDYVKGIVTLKHVDEEKDYPIKPPNEFCGTINTKEAVIELREVTTVETAPLLGMNMFSIETKIEVEAPSKEEAASPIIEASPEVEAVSFFDLDDLTLEKLFEDEVPSSEEATPPLARARAEIKVPQDMQGADAKQFETKVHLQKEATSQTVSTVLKKKKAKKAKNKQPEQVQHEPDKPPPPSFTLKPSKIVAGKLECTVKSKGYSKPFAKARIILDSNFTSDSDLSVVTAKMANLFGIKLDDRGPFPDGSSQST